MRGRFWMIGKMLRDVATSPRKVQSPRKREGPPASSPSSVKYLELFTFPCLRINSLKLQAFSCSLVQFALGLAVQSSKLPISECQECTGDWFFFLSI